jgi:Mrp family chromosome partitioning ATPase
VSTHQAAALMPRWADAVVWVVKADHSPADVVADSMDLVGRDKIIGVVLNGHKTKLPGWLDRLL